MYSFTICLIYTGCYSSSVTKCLKIISFIANVLSEHDVRVSLSRLTLIEYIFISHYFWRKICSLLVLARAIVYVSCGNIKIFLREIRIKNSVTTFCLTQRRGRVVSAFENREHSHLPSALIRRQQRTVSCLWEQSSVLIKDSSCENSI